MTARRATAAAIRTVGIGVLGLIGGLLFAIILQDVLSRALLSADGTPSALGVILGAALPVCGLVGAALALWVDRRRGRNHR